MLDAPVVEAGQAECRLVPGGALALVTLVTSSALHRGNSIRGGNASQSRAMSHGHGRDADSVILVKGVSGGSVVKYPATGLYYLLGWSRATMASV